jgi:hypothetical protein
MKEGAMHVACTAHVRNPYKTLLQNVKIPLGRHKGKNNIEMDVYTIWCKYVD